MSEKKRAPVLMDEYPILVYPSLAVALGINRAVVFQQLHFLLNGQKEAKNAYNFVEGKWWVYNSYQEWHETYFKWLAPVTLKGIFNSLEKDGLIISMQSVKNPSDRRKWYTINYEAWDKFYLTIGQKISDEPTDKKYPMVGQKISDGYSETSTETTTKTTTTRKRDDIYDAIAYTWNTEASGFIVSLKGMFMGTAKKGEWKNCNITPAATPDEIRAFKTYADKRMQADSRQRVPMKPTTIQMWFYDMRNAHSKPKPVFEIPEGHYDPAKDDGTPATPEQIAAAKAMFAELVKSKSGNTQVKPS